MAKGAWAGCCIILPPGGSRGLEISRLRRHERVPSLHADQREATGPPEAAQRPAVFAGRRFDGKTAYDPVPFRESVNPASFATTRRISITSPAKRHRVDSSQSRRISRNLASLLLYLTQLRDSRQEFRFDHFFCHGNSGGDSRAEPKGRS